MHYIEERSSELATKNLDIKSIENKFDKVEHLMMDLSTKHKQIATLQKRIESLKTDTDEMRLSMESLLEEADDKYTKLSEYMNHIQSQIDMPLSAPPKQAATKTVTKSAQTIIKDPMADQMKRKRATVLNLYHNYSWTSDTIAQKLNLDKSLVESIIKNS